MGNSVLYSRKGYDGVVQIYPMNCMPEIVAGSILPAVSKDCNLPVLTLIMDEISGEAGYKTRVEAFVDMLQRKSNKKKEQNELVLFRD